MFNSRKTTYILPILLVLIIFSTMCVFLISAAGNTRTVSSNKSYRKDGVGTPISYEMLKAAEELNMSEDDEYAFAVHINSAYPKATRILSGLLYTTISENLALDGNNELDASKSDYFIDVSDTIKDSDLWRAYQEYHNPLIILSLSTCENSTMDLRVSFSSWFGKNYYSALTEDEDFQLNEEIAGTAAYCYTRYCSNAQWELYTKDTGVLTKNGNGSRGVLQMDISGDASNAVAFVTHKFNASILKQLVVAPKLDIMIDNKYEWAALMGLAHNSGASYLGTYQVGFDTNQVWLSEDSAIEFCNRLGTSAVVEVIRKHAKDKFAEVDNLLKYDTSSIIQFKIDDREALAMLKEAGVNIDDYATSKGKSNFDAHASYPVRMVYYYLIYEMLYDMEVA